MQEIKDKSEYHLLTNLGTGKVLINFTATWCGPCQKIKPEIIEMSKAYPGVGFYTVDVDKLPDVSESQRINSVPTFQIWSNGIKIFEIKGARIPMIAEALARLN